MALFSTCRAFSGSLLLACAVPANAQSFYHAPPTSPQQSSLLPVIQPRHSSRAGDSQRSPFEIWPAKKPAEVQPANVSQGAVAVPAHLLANSWSRLPDGSAARAVPPAPAPATNGNGMDARAVAAQGNQPPQPPGSDDLGRALSVAAHSTKAGDVTAAKRILETTMSRYPNDVRPALSLARLNESQKDWAGAEAAYRKVTALEPADPRWKLRLAECYYRQGNYAEALAAYQVVSESSATMTYDEISQYGDAALRVNDSAAAEVAFNKLASLKSVPDPKVELLRGLAALKQGKTQEARGILLQAAARWPQDADLTEALRVTSSAHYGDEVTVAKNAAVSEPVTEAPKEILETSAFAEIEETKLTGTGSSVGWRRSRSAAPETPPQNLASMSLNSAKLSAAYAEAASEAAAKKAAATDGWRATRSRGEPAPLSMAGEKEPRPLPLD